MNTETLFLSITQGISEILPISSSVNLHLFAKLFHFDTFDFGTKIALHCGSLLTFLIYFGREIIDILKGLFTRSKKLKLTFFWPLIVGTIPVVILGFIARNFVKEFDSSFIMGISCAVFGILLFMFDKLAGDSRRAANTFLPSIPKAFIIGCFQAVSIFPGISRLGICITACRFLNIDRKNSILFSMLLAIPSICGSTTLEIVENMNHNATANMFSLNSCMGILLTMLIGLICIRLFVYYMKKHGFLHIAIYRIIIGISLLFM
ncbi:MAG: hypothetical protein LBF65_03335 [Holosporales bacterium]|jgi:undecaprenyl-diphosphatase|nr:hypothetical protein [Holosporales bacterium]